MPDLVDCFVLRFREDWGAVGGGSGEGGFFEEEADFIAGG